MDQATQERLLISVVSVSRLFFPPSLQQIQETSDLYLVASKDEFLCWPDTRLFSDGALSPPPLPPPPVSQSDLMDLEEDP